MLKSIPGGMFWVQNATCSVSAKKLSTTPIQDQTADDANRKHFLRNELGGIENIEFELVRELLVEQLHAEFPLREIAARNRVPKIAPVEIRVRAVDLDGLVPHHRLQAELRLPVEFDERGFALLHPPIGTYERRSLP